MATPAIQLCVGIYKLIHSFIHKTVKETATANSESRYDLIHVT